MATSVEKVVAHVPVIRTASHVRSTLIQSSLNSLRDAGHFDRKGWGWPLYRPLVQFALESGWPIVAANLSRTEARALVADPGRSELAPAAPSVRGALERDIIDGHCGAAPEPKRLGGMVEAQRAVVELKDRYFEAVANYFRRQAALDRAVAMPLDSASSPPVKRANDY